jgi:peptide/nickel transport system permease protein
MTAAGATSALGAAWRGMRRRPLGFAGVLGVGVFTAAALAGPWVAPYDPFALRPEAMMPPGRGHWLGTDDLGRDVLSGVLHGARVSLAVGVLAAAGAVVIGITVGAAAGYRRGRLDEVLMRLTEWVLVVPQFLIVLVVAAIFGADLRLVIAVLALVGWPATARLTRAQFLTLSSREFVAAARGVGAPERRIVAREILPNALPPIVVAGSLQIPSAILSEASLRFLGLADPHRLSWGSMLNQAQNFLQQAWWMPLFPGAAIFLTVLSFNLAGEALNEMLDPHARNPQRGEKRTRRARS